MSLSGGVDPQLLFERPKESLRRSRHLTSAMITNSRPFVSPMMAEGCNDSGITRRGPGRLHDGSLQVPIEA